MNKLLHYALGGLLFSYVFSSYIATDSNDNKKVLKDDGNLNGSIGDVAEFPKINRGKHVSAQVTPEGKLTFGYNARRMDMKTHERKT